MNLTEIKNKILPYIKQFISKAKEILKLPYAKAYIALSIPLIIIFFIFTFPYEIIIREQIKKLEPNVGNIYVGTIDAGLILDSYIDSIVMSFQSGSELKFKDISFNVAINPITTLINKTLDGKINIEELKYVNNETSFAGVMKTNFDLKFIPNSVIPSDGFLNLDLQNVSLKGINIKGFDIPPVHFSSINAKTEIQKNNLKISLMQFSGTDIRGTIKGNIMLSPFLFNSNLNITIEIDPQSKIIDNYKTLLGSTYKGGNEKIIIVITGTLRDPKINFPAMAGN